MVELPLRSPDVTVDDGEPRVVGVDSEDADDLLSVLSSTTARDVLQAIHADPAPPSEIADRIGASIQTVHYHLGNMEAAGVIEVADTVYSEKGREMKIYAPAHGPIVVFAGDEDTGEDLRDVLVRTLGAVGFLAVASLLVQEVLGGGLAAVYGGRSADGPTALGPQRETFAQATKATVTEPGVAFFLGGLAVILAGLAVWYYRQSRQD